MRTAGPSPTTRHPDAFDARYIAEWIIKRFLDLASNDIGLPLLVPLTVTFAPTSVRPDRVLIEFERFYARVCRQLINNCERPSKRHLLPFAIAWRDDPRTRPDKYRSKPVWHAQFFNHPSVAPHVHALMVLHPLLAERFQIIANGLEATWRAIPRRHDQPIDQPSYNNRTLRIEHDLGQRLSHGLSCDEGSIIHHDARTELGRWLGYCAKLTKRFDAGEGDIFTVLPTLASASSR